MIKINDMKGITVLLTVYLMLTFSGCNNPKKKDMKEKEGTYGYDLNFLKEKDKGLIVLKGYNEKAEVIVSPKYQAKVFTSTTTGPEGASLGFVNHDVLNSSVIDEHMNGYGGENRFWLGPEGGKYSVFFEPGKEQVFDNWHTPKAIDTESWDVKEILSEEVTLTKDMELNNYQGNILRISAHRKIKILSSGQVEQELEVQLPEGINVVAYSTVNKITNLNDFKWDEKTGTVCIWILDMFNPSDSAVTVVPYNEGDETEMGVIATTGYFGEIPSDRIQYEPGTLYLKTDGQYRSKLGMSAKRTKAIAGNYDPLSKRLTIITFDADPTAVYLNQEWNPGLNPLVGDALNAYNDGPLEDGSIMGPFLELESCSPAAFLKPGESLSHRHNVFHFTGEEAVLSPVCEKLMGVSLEKVKRIF
ncbi:MAG: hypothetical protein JXR41_06915 [Bacteroidales bacterium]|nr:hypothetical protein [Bacteroidales bacterium]